MMHEQGSPRRFERPSGGQAGEQAYDGAHDGKCKHGRRQMMVEGVRRPGQGHANDPVGQGAENGAGDSTDGHIFGHLHGGKRLRPLRRLGRKVFPDDVRAGFAGETISFQVVNGRHRMKLSSHP